jgi:hypothetical protein
MTGPVAAEPIPVHPCCWCRSWLTLYADFVVLFAMQLLTFLAAVHGPLEQGDPGSTFAFCVTLQDPLEQTLAANPDAPRVAFSDDVTVIAGADACLRGVPTLIDACEPLGLGVKKPKCGVTSANAEASARVAQGLAMPDRPEGLLVAGTARGTAQFIAEHAQRKADIACGFVNKLMELPLPVQDQMLLLRMPLQKKLSHLPRTTPWNYIQDAVLQLEGKVRSAVLDIVKQPGKEPPPELSAQLVLPLRHGGLGLQATSVMVATAAFVSGAATAHVTLCGTQLQPFNADMAAAWQLVYDAAAQMGNGAPWPEDTRGADAAAIEQVIQFAQRDFARHESAATHATLLASLEPDSPAEARTLARLRSCSARASSAALDALPTGPTMVLSDSDATSMLRFRLGLMTLPTTALGLPCACGRRLLASDADHALTCKSLNGSVTARHDNLNRIVCRDARRAGVASSVEPQLRQLQLAAEQAGRRGRQA